MGGGSGPHKPVYEPTTDSQFGEDETGDGVVLAPPRHRSGLDDEAYRLTRKDGAPGIDGVTAAEYEVNLEANLLDLVDRIKSLCDASDAGLDAPAIQHDAPALASEVTLAAGNAKSSFSEI